MKKRLTNYLELINKLYEVINLKNLIGKEVFEFQPHEQIGNAVMNYDDKYYTLNKGKIERVAEKYGLVYIDRIPYQLEEFKRWIKPNKNGYRHWVLK